MLMNYRFQLKKPITSLEKLSTDVYNSQKRLKIPRNVSNSLNNIKETKDFINDLNQKKDQQYLKFDSEIEKLPTLIKND